MRPRRIALLSVSLALALGGAARADVIKLENGREVEGEIVREDSDEVEIKLVSGSATFKRSQIESIERKPSPEQEYQKRREALAANDAPGRVELAIFCDKKHLPRARVPALAVEAFKIDARLRSALDLLAKLDCRFESGEWVVPETWYPAHGWVRVENRWITPEDGAFQEAKRTADQARTLLEAAQKNVTRLEEKLASFPDHELEARKRLARARDDVDAIDAKGKAAQADLDARENDLSIAAANTLAARQARQTLENQGAPKDQKLQQDYQDRLAQAQLVERKAIVTERQARADRDAALAVVKDLNDRRVAAVRAAERLRSALEALVAEEKKAQDELPKVRSALSDAKSALPRAEAAEAEARKAATERKQKEDKAASERAAALEKWQKEHDPLPAKDAEK